jgi:hypothetical protein
MELKKGCADKESTIMLIKPKQFAAAFFTSLFVLKIKVYVCHLIRQHSGPLITIWQTSASIYVFSNLAFLSCMEKLSNSLITGW